MYDCTLCMYVCSIFSVCNVHRHVCVCTYIVYDLIMHYVYLFLIGSDFDISQPDANGRTALHWALEKKKFSKAEILLDHDAGEQGVVVTHSNPQVSDM